MNMHTFEGRLKEKIKKINKLNKIKRAPMELIIRGILLTFAIISTNGKKGKHFDQSQNSAISKLLNLTTLLQIV